jgi:uncharacterized protein YcbX
MNEVGRVIALWRYPMKSFLGERLEEAALDPNGVEGDRGYALRDASSGHVLSAKKVSMLLRARAQTRNGSVVLTLPDGTSIDIGSADAAKTLATWLGRDVDIVRPSGTSERPVVEGDSGPFLGRPGGFFDSSAVHIVTTSTLATLKERHPEGVFDPRRFRPNIVLETPDDGYVEERWIGSTLSVGGAAIEITKPCSRCVMTTHAQEELPVDRDILRTVIVHNEEHVGVYGIVRTPGVVRVGDHASLTA